MKLKYFQLAEKVSRLSDHPQHQIGSVLVKGNKIISLASNKYKTHPKSPHPWKHLHSEINALISAREDVNGCDIYVFRRTKPGKLGLAKPCTTCLPAIAASGISRVFFTTDGGYDAIQLT